MGFQDRDYVRSDSSSGWFGGTSGGADVIVKLIIVNVAIYFAQIVWTQSSGNPLFPFRESVVTSWFEMDTSKVLFQGQVWRVFTYMFLHSPEPNAHWHLIFNMFVLYFAGKKVADWYGSREFLLFYLAAGVMGAVASIGLDVATQDFTRCVGSSGAVSGVLLLYACNWPQDIWRLFFVIPVPAVLLVVGSGLLDLIAVLHRLGGNSVGDNVGHAVHLGGMLFGYVYHRSQWRLAPMYQAVTRFQWKKSSLGTSVRARARGFRVVRPDDDPVDLDSKVDELLQKIHDQGEASLTEKERAILMEASRRKRARSEGS